MIESNKLASSFIFSGSQEETFELAKEFAKIIACNSQNKPCNNCLACHKVNKDCHPDVIVVDTKYIDDIRDNILNNLYLSPNEADKKIYIIKNSQDLTVEAQNALLKSFEEPPSFVIILMLAESLDSILETVKSRAVKFSINLDINLSDNYNELINKILENKNTLELYQEIIKTFEKKSRDDLLNFYASLESALRDIAVAKVFNNNNNFADSYSYRKIFDFSKKINKYKSDLDNNANIKLNLSAFFSEVSI